jgi:hypothetical protein
MTGNALRYKTLMSTEPTELMGRRARCLGEQRKNPQCAAHELPGAACQPQHCACLARLPTCLPRTDVVWYGHS